MDEKILIALEELATALGDFANNHAYHTDRKNQELCEYAWRLEDAAVKLAKIVGELQKEKAG